MTSAGRSAGRPAPGIRAESRKDLAGSATDTRPLAMTTHRSPRRPAARRHRAPHGRAGAEAGRDRLYEIDLLRITAALAVVIYHYTFSGCAGHLIPVSFPALRTVTRYGYLGVDMFFTISGFVVLLSAWGRRPLDFVISRITRLYPAYCVVTRNAMSVMTTKMTVMMAAITGECRTQRFTAWPMRSMRTNPLYACTR